MTLYNAFPLFYTPNFDDVTNSGIANVYGHIVHGPTTGSGSVVVTPSSFPFNYDGDHGSNLYILKPTTSQYYLFGYSPNQSSTNFAFLPIQQINNVNHFYPDISKAETQLDATTTYSGIIQVLGFNYTVEADIRLRKGNFSFLGYLNVISVENIYSYIVPTEQQSIDFTALSRIISKNSTYFNVSIYGIGPHEIYQIFTRDQFVYSAVGNGLEIFDINTGSIIYFKELTDEIFKTIWGNNTTLYIGSIINGLFEISYEELHADYINATLKESTFIDTKNVTFIHGNKNKVLVCTSSGVEFFDYSGNPNYKSKTDIPNAIKCFMTSNKAYYINYTTTSGGAVYNIHRQDYLNTDWVGATRTYSTGGGILESDIYLTDIFITEQTAAYNGNTIFCTTSSGIYVIDEDTLEYAIYYTS